MINYNNIIHSTVHPIYEYEGLFYAIVSNALTLLLISIAVVSFDTTWKYTPIIMFSAVGFMLLIAIFDYVSNRGFFVTNGIIELSRLDLTTVVLIVVLFIVFRLLWKSIIKLS